LRFKNGTLFASALTFPEFLATSLTAATTKKRRIRFKPENERKEDFAAASVIWLAQI